mmetsp:Transcript_28523/g.60435  ORF Transcript_28523/g.60435 Transcript_28523/m.60435 type:complete len:340 (+) Transcript_28523:172-1191(+)
MGLQRSQASYLNRYSSISQHTSSWGTAVKCLYPIFAVSLVAILFIQKTTTQTDIAFGTAINVQASHESRCWLKYAAKSGIFLIFSHRSYVDNTQELQPSCEESLMQLKGIGVNHIDLDLVLDERNESDPRLIVAHPLEFKRKSEYYSPCANSGFDEMLEIVKKVFGEEYFLSMEPKAAWGMTVSEYDDAALTNTPSSILEQLLEGIERHRMKGKCAAIVELNNKRDQNELALERNLMGHILQHCQLFRGVRLADKAPVSMEDYDIIMPTIEFHPLHPHNTDRKVIPSDLDRESIFWVVDNEVDLQYAADLHSLGIVSNSPRNIMKIMNDAKWCHENGMQ